MSNILNSFTNLGTWPDGCFDQQDYMQRLNDGLRALSLYLSSSGSLVVTVSQATEPTQAQWEAAWVIQTGVPLPVTPNGVLLWYNTAEDTFGGVFGTVPGDGTIYRREHIYPRGATIIFEQNTLINSSLSTTNDIYSNNANMPSLSFVLPTVCDVLLTSRVSAFITSGTGFWGLDFMLNGTKVGTTYGGALANWGLTNRDNNSNAVAEYLLKDLPAGSYTVNAMFGVVGAPSSPPTVAVGTQSARTLTVRAIAK